jgi:hypothetical protein
MSFVKRWAPREVRLSMLTSSFLTLFFDVIISFLILVREGRPSMILFEGRGADILLVGSVHDSGFEDLVSQLIFRLTTGRQEKK